MQTSTPQSLAARVAAFLGDVTDSLAHRYGVRDHLGLSLDCLKVVPMGENDYLGVSHARIADRFVLRLSRSRDLLEWRHVVDLDGNASQGDLAPQPDGSFWLAYEHDEPNSVFVRLRRYASRADLEKGRWAFETTLGRTLAPTAEGTPTIERVERDVVRLRLHYYRDGDVDRAAAGILRGLGDWSVAPDRDLNAALEAKGVRGNIGGRCRVRLFGRIWYLQEGQGRKNDWASWRCWLMDDPPRNPTAIPLRTHGGSTAFANPFAVALPGPKPRVVVTWFLPSEGAASGEAGPLLYVKALGDDPPPLPKKDDPQGTQR